VHIFSYFYILYRLVNLNSLLPANMGSPEDSDIVPDEKPQGYTSAVQSGGSLDSKENDSGDKGGVPFVSELPPYEDAEHQGDHTTHLDTAEDIVTTVIHVEDDPTLNPWTFRMFFIGDTLAPQALLRPPFRSSIAH
jgi:hypothetical protein